MINSYLYIYITLSSADAPREGIPSPHNFNRRQRGTRYDSPKSIVSESEVK